MAFTAIGGLQRSRLAQVEWGRYCDPHMTRRQEALSINSISISSEDQLNLLSAHPAALHSKQCVTHVIRLIGVIV